MAQQPLGDKGLLIVAASRSHSDTPHSERLLCTSDHPTQRPLPDKTQLTQQTDIHRPTTGGIQTRNPSKRVVIGLRLRPRGHRPTPQTAWPLGAIIIIIIINTVL